jgi:hypothetical protein
MHHEFVPPGQCYWSFLRASSVEEAGRQVAGRDSGFCIMITHWATHCLLCHHPITVLSGSRSQWRLAVPYSENGPQGDTFRNYGGHKIECDGRSPEDSNRSHPPVLPTVAGSMEQVCARKGPTSKVIRYALLYALPLQCNTTIQGTFWLPILHVCVCIYVYIYIHTHTKENALKSKGKRKQGIYFIVMSFAVMFPCESAIVLLQLLYNTGTASCADALTAAEGEAKLISLMVKS